MVYREVKCRDKGALVVTELLGYCTTKLLGIVTGIRDPVIDSVNYPCTRSTSIRA